MGAELLDYRGLIMGRFLGETFCGDIKGGSQQWGVLSWVEPWGIRCQGVSWVSYGGPLGDSLGEVLCQPL